MDEDIVQVLVLSSDEEDRSLSDTSSADKYGKMALVGGALLSGSIQVLCEKIASGEFMAFFQARRLNYSLMDKLKMTLLTLHAVLNDAEEKHIVNLAVGKWLDELKHAVFEGEDLVDEIDTEALRHKVKDQTKQTQVCNFLSTSRNPFKYKGMNGRIEELFQRLERLAEQRNLLGLIESIGSKVSQRTPTTSVVEEGFCPYGRDKDKEKLKTLLLLSDNESSSSFSVVPIVGMGGVGKTTLAQLLYNDEQVKEHFNVHAWVCVSEQYDALRVVKTLIEQITEKSYGEKYLHTFFPVSLTPYEKMGDKVYLSNKVQDDFLPTQKYLRVISLSRYQNITHLPDSIGNHIHLRYIDLSYTAIRRLPDTVCTLYNLQTLLLLGCFFLVELPANMGKLIHLRHLDIGGTDIKKMPIKKPENTTAFVLGKSTGSSIGELRELSHLGGKISILNLQNVIGAIDPLLKDKKDLNEVELAWVPNVSDDSVKKRYVLERLQPSVNLVKLTIRGYGGISFPNWVGDSSFSNLQVMRLIDCDNCSSLPPVGQLPALKELYVEGMKSVVSVGVDLYGGNQTFQSLEKLEFSSMPEWEEWLPSPSGGEIPDFPRLKELKLSQCPKLRGNLPTHLPSLKTLDVSFCEVLHVNRASNTLNTESLRGSLEKLTVNKCPGLSLLLESTETLLSLQMLDIKYVDIKWLPQMVPNSNRLQSLTLGGCSSLLSFPTNGLPTTLTSLRIDDCRKLEFLSREMMAKLTSLQSLYLSYSCDSLRSFPLGIFPKLSSLQIRVCGNLESLSVEGGADENLSPLNSLSIWHCRNLVSFPDGGLPTPNLTLFDVNNCANLKLLPDRMHTLTALQRLAISSLPNVVSFAQGGLPPNLQSFQIFGASKDFFQTLLNEQLLPATLHTLAISYVSNLKSLDGKGLEHLTSLQQLQISGCESLKFLPKEGLPASLSYLSILDCPSLKKRYLKKRYEKVARIPCIEIDGEVNIL
ncbi:hypothetical protein DVH24_038107 [Malus domestica]|uniref:Rx N-terminal domain-containing protein n=1 Tax=Malus domestica TaxID=3750 RepID=A0A498KEE5_MALDO|nr:hypothetical protein DVH24_038107 [Malus domestica]